MFIYIYIYTYIHVACNLAHGAPPKTNRLRRTSNASTKHANTSTSNNHHTGNNDLY